MYTFKHTRLRLPPDSKTLAFCHGGAVENEDWRVDTENWILFHPGKPVHLGYKPRSFQIMRTTLSSG